MKNKNAFTLIELLAVIIILGIILMIAVPSYNEIVKLSRKRKCESDVAAILSLAETCVQKSIVSNSDYDVCNDLGKLEGMDSDLKSTGSQLSIEIGKNPGSDDYSIKACKKDKDCSDDPNLEFTCPD